jgi:hypothetical protein
MSGMMMGKKGGERRELATDPGGLTTTETCACWPFRRSP